MGATPSTVVFEETQRSNYPRQWWQVLGCGLALAGTIRTGDLLSTVFVGLLLVELLMVPLFAPLTIRLTDDRLRVRLPLHTDTTYGLDQIVRCEAIDYHVSFWRGPTGNGLVFPSSCVRVRNRGVRLDLTDGLHLLIGSQEPDRLAALIRERKASPVAA